MCCTCVNVLNCPCAVMFVGNCFSTPCWRNVAHVLHMCCTCVSVLKYPCARQKLKKNQVFCTCVHVICTCAHVNAHVPYMWIHVHMCRTFLYMGILTSPQEVSPVRRVATRLTTSTTAASDWFFGATPQFKTAEARPLPHCPTLATYLPHRQRIQFQAGPSFSLHFVTLFSLYKLLAN